MTNQKPFTRWIRNNNNPQCVILDMDSTLSQPVGESWDDTLNHQPIQPILDLAHTLHKHGYDLVISTARPESNRPDTESWLYKHLPQFSALYMRSVFIKASTMKEEALRDIDEMYDVAFAIDDSPFNAKIYADNGVLCMRPMTNEAYWASMGDS